MARCEQGYLCEICGNEVAEIIDSDLYLRYVLGEVDPEKLHLLPDRHIRCNPSLAQFIVAEGFEPVFCPGLFGKENLDSDWVAQEERRVTSGWRHLQKLQSLGLAIIDYPLPEVRNQYRAKADEF